MDNRINIVGDCYKKFDLKHTSKSQNSIEFELDKLIVIIESYEEKENVN
mgnify:CR=1 FL=1